MTERGRINSMSDSATFRRVGHLDSSWDISECSVCFALVSSESQDEHANWHRSGAQSPDVSASEPFDPLPNIRAAVNFVRSHYGQEGPNPMSGNPREQLPYGVDPDDPFPPSGLLQWAPAGAQESIIDPDLDDLHADVRAAASEAASRLQDHQSDETAAGESNP